MSKLIKNLEEQSIWKLLLSYSIPSIVASSVHALYNIVDRIYIGQALGTTALAGITLTFPVFIFSIAVGILLSSGATALVSLELGKKNFFKAEKILGNTFSAFMIAGILVSGIGLFFLKDLLYLVGADESTFSYAYNYLLFFIPFMFFDFLAMGTNGLIRSEGNPKLAMLIASGGALLNIILDPIFLFGFGWGVKGVALATAISRILTTFCVFWHFTKSKKRILTLKFSNLLPDLRLLRQIIVIGFSPFIMSLSTTFVAIFSNRAVVGYGGAVAMGAFGAIHSLYIVMETPLRGLMIAAQPIIGYNYGAKKIIRVKETVKFSYLFAIIISLSALTGIIFYADELIGMFSSDQKMIKVGSRGVVLYLIMSTFMGLHMIGATYFQAIAKAGQSIFLNVLRKVILYLPALWLLPLWFELDGVWLSNATADLLACLVSLYMVEKSLRKEKARLFKA